MTEKAASKIGSISDLLNAPRAEYIGDIKVNVIAPMFGKLFGEIDAGSTCPRLLASCCCSSHASSMI